MADEKAKISIRQSVQAILGPAGIKNSVALAG
jgi:hypothetical protein